MDIHLIRVPQDADVVNVRCRPAKWGECPAFFSAHVDSYEILSYSMTIVAGLCHVELVFVSPFRVCIFRLVTSLVVLAGRPEEACEVHVKACHQAKNTNVTTKYLYLVLFFPLFLCCKGEVVKSLCSYCYYLWLHFLCVTGFSSSISFLSLSPLLPFLISLPLLILNFSEADLTTAILTFTILCHHVQNTRSSSFLLVSTNFIICTLASCQI